MGKQKRGGVLRDESLHRKLKDEITKRGAKSYRRNRERIPGRSRMKRGRNGSGIIEGSRRGNVFRKYATGAFSKEQGEKF
jgi:hypothetical protein